MDVDLVFECTGVFTRKEELEKHLQAGAKNVVLSAPGKGDGVPPERKRTTTWPAFIRTHLVLLAGTDFFTAEILTLGGLVTYYVLFFIHLESRRVDIAGITVHPDEPWMKQSLGT
jgi:hypothetical protein